VVDHPSGRSDKNVNAGRETLLVGVDVGPSNNADNVEVDEGGEDLPLVGNLRRKLTGGGQNQGADTTSLVEVVLLENVFDCGKEKRNSLASAGLGLGEAIVLLSNDFWARLRLDIGHALVLENLRNRTLDRGSNGEGGKRGRCLVLGSCRVGGLDWGGGGSGLKVGLVVVVVVVVVVGIVVVVVVVGIVLVAISITIPIVAAATVESSHRGITTTIRVHVTLSLTD